MVQEVRTIKFGMDELSQALHAYRRINPSLLPQGKIFGVQPNPDKSLTVAIDTEHASASEVHVTLHEDDVAEVLIRFCIENNIKLPRQSAKEVLYADGAAMLLIELELLVG